MTCARRGVAYGDIAILCGNMAAYASVLDTVLRQYDIPAYIAVKEPLLSHGLVRLLLSAVRAATGGYRAEDMLAAIKSLRAAARRNVRALSRRVKSYILS